jgi:hypothetical protein
MEFKCIPSKIDYLTQFHSIHIHAYIWLNIKALFIHFHLGRASSPMLVLFWVLWQLIFQFVHKESRSWCFQVQLVICWHLSGVLYQFEVYSLNSYQTISDNPEVLDFNHVIIHLELAVKTPSGIYRVPFISIMLGLNLVILYVGGEKKVPRFMVLGVSFHLGRLPTKVWWKCRCHHAKSTYPLAYGGRSSLHGNLTLSLQLHLRHHQGIDGAMTHVPDFECWSEEQFVS